MGNESLKALICACLMIVWISVPGHRALAMSPVIIRHDAQFMQNEVRLNIAWQSEEPVMKIIASAGKGQVVIDKNIGNDRNEAGYSGEIDIIVPAYPYNAASEQSTYLSRQSTNQAQQSSVEMYANSASSSNEAIQYTVQLIDETNQRSTLLKERIYSAEPTIHLSGQKPQSRSFNSTVSSNAKDPLNTAVTTTRNNEEAQPSPPSSPGQTNQHSAPQTAPPTMPADDIPVMDIPGL